MILSNFSVPIGMPIFNTKCYILDRDLSPLPLGAIGELYIGGVGVARGYINKPMLTSEKFKLTTIKMHVMEIFPAAADRSLRAADQYPLRIKEKHVTILLHLQTMQLDQ